MVKLSERSRRILRRIYQGLGAATISILFQACYGPVYGPPMDEDIIIKGKVSSKTQDPIPGIRVSVENLSSNRYSYTNENGIFFIDVPQRNSYELQFMDVDGYKNGFYQTLKKTISLSDTNMTLDIQLDDENNIIIRGKVISKTQDPIPGIKVSVGSLSSTIYDYSYTNDNGFFFIIVPQQSSYVLQFEDIDGALNGSYKTRIKMINLDDTDTTQQFQLEEADEE